jgi:hypothetical protein
MSFFTNISGLASDKPAFLKINGMTLKGIPVSRFMRFSFWNFLSAVSALFSLEIEADLVSFF